MKLKSIITSAVLLLLVGTATAQRFTTPALTTANDATDNVAGMAMDDNFTYVVQNLYTNPSSGPLTSNSFASWGTSVVTTGEHASVVVERINKTTGAVGVLGRIDIGSYGSSVTATAVTLANNRLYVVGYFNDNVNVSALGARNSQGIDMFIWSINATGGSVAWAQSTGLGEEHATCVTEVLGSLYVGGYYTATAGVPVSSTWGATTAPGIGANGQRNTFIAHYSTALVLGGVNGWMTLANNNSSAQINGIVTTSASGSTVSYVTGAITGSATTPPLAGVAGGAVMFTARFVNTNLFGPPFSNTWGWALTEGTFYTVGGGGANPVNAGKAIIFGPSSTTELYVAGAAAYTSGSGPIGYHNGQSDAVLVRFTSITALTPTKAYVVPMGTNGGNDVANGIVSDGTGVIVTGSMGSNDYSYASIGNPTISYTAVALSHTFAARYSTLGVNDWDKTSNAFSLRSAGTAIACNRRCHVAIGGSFDRRLDWGNVFEIYGAATPVTDHLYANLLPVQWMKFNPALPPSMFRPSMVPVTASGATTYAWGALPNGGQTVSVTPPNTASVTINLGGLVGAGTTFDVVAIGTYTHSSGVTCTNGIQHRVFQVNKKEDETATGIEDAVESLNTLNVFPNPFVNTVQMDYSFAAPGEGLMQVVDLQGRVVAERVLSNQSSSETVTTSEWAAGTYIINLTQAGKTIFSKQIVK